MTPECYWVLTSQTQSSTQVNDDRKLHQTADVDYTSRTQAKTLQRSEVEKIRRAAREITDASPRTVDRLPNLFRS